MRDEEMWYLGQYIMSALDSTVCNGFVWRKKGSKPGKYIKKPFMQQLEEHKNKKELTEEEKKKQTEQLFMRLRLMQSNFNLNHKDGKGS